MRVLFVLLACCICAVQGGPNIGVCLGLIDDVDGVASLPLGPTPEQEMSECCTSLWHSQLHKAALMIPVVLMTLPPSSCLYFCWTPS